MLMEISASLRNVTMGSMVSAKMPLTQKTQNPQKKKNMHSMYTSKIPQTLAGNLLYNLWNRNLEDK